MNSDITKSGRAYNRRSQYPEIFNKSGQNLSGDITKSGVNYFVKKNEIEIHEIRDYNLTK